MQYIQYIRGVWNKYNSLQKSVLLGLSVIAGLTSIKIRDLFRRKLYKLLPGPRYGSLWLFNKYWYIASMANSYGSVFMMYLGNLECIFICDAKLIRKTLQRTEFCHHRPMHDVSGYYPLYDLQYNKPYMIRRKIIHESFNTNKLNNNNFNNISEDIVKHTIYKTFNDNSKQTSHYTSDDLSMIVKLPIFEMIFKATFGTFLNVKDCVDDKSYTLFMESLNDMFEDLEFSFLLKMILGNGYIGKTIRKLTIAHKTNTKALFGINMVDKWYKLSTNEANLAKRRVNNKGNEFDDDCMLSILLNAQKSIKLPILEQHIKSDLLVVFFGVHTTGRSIVEAIILCAIYEDIQDKLYDEIMNINYKSYKDNNRLHLLRAFVHESLRLCTTGFFTGVVRTIEDDNVFLNQYKINKNSIVLPCYPYAMHDKKYWETPNQFNLNHFLNLKTGTFKKNIAFNKFGVGKRDCPGIGLAKSMMISLLAYLLKKYKFIATNMNKDTLPRWNGSGIFWHGLMQTNVSVVIR